MRLGIILLCKSLGELYTYLTNITVFLPTPLRQYVVCWLTLDFQQRYGKVATMSSQTE